MILPCWCKKVTNQGPSTLNPPFHLCGSLYSNDGAHWPQRDGEGHWDVQSPLFSESQREVVVGEWRQTVVEALSGL